jgi:catechol 2,3-dioxygenase-like lactoylglutathione lyase family enzyme
MAGRRPAASPRRAESDNGFNTGGRAMNLKSIYHININCTNLERSLEFYKMLGFREVVDFGEGGGAEMGKGLRMPSDSRARARLLKIGDDPYCSHIDLIEWLNPRSDKPPYERLNNLGIARVCFYSKDLEGDLAELKSRGTKVLSDPMTVRYKGGQSTVVCFEDPDGTILELVQYKKTPAKS